jgi:hypothetical protein
MRYLTRGNRRTNGIRVNRDGNSMTGSRQQEHWKLILTEAVLDELLNGTVIKTQVNERQTTQRL